MLKMLSLSDQYNCNCDLMDSFEYVLILLKRPELQQFLV